MTPLQECIAECGVNAPLYTVPDDKHPKPMVVTYVRTDEALGIIVSYGGPVEFHYDQQGQHHYGYAPDIAPVMPKPGERWLCLGDYTAEVSADEDGLLWATNTIGGSWRIDRWGRALPEPEPGHSLNLILPYIQPHD